MAKSKKIEMPAGKKTNKIMTKKPHPMAHEVMDYFKRDYEFVKPHSENSPVRPWEHRHIVESVHTGEDSYVDARLRTMVMKTHHGFGHEGKSQVQGNLRMSGKKGSHQIGKRSKAGAR